MRLGTSLLRRSLARLSGALALCLSYAFAADPVELDTIQVTATRIPKPTASVPAAINVLDLSRTPNFSLNANLSEKLAPIPGVLARNRQNYAQDEQISIRGFGARATFGVRGVRLYVDGIPATMPDGQGQLGHVNLAAAQRIELLRGPFSALYGNAAGGVLQVFTADGITDPGLGFALNQASFDFRRFGAFKRGGDQQLNFHGALSYLETAGSRNHSAAKRSSVNAKLNVALGPKAKLSFVANAFAAPNSEDPLGLTQEQFLTDPRQTSPLAATFNTRKSVTQQQLGLVYEHVQGLRLLSYLGTREVQQFLSVPPVAQRSPLSAGGMIDLQSPYHGVEARWSQRATLLERTVDFSVGFNFDRQNQHRRGFENFVGSQLGIRGALRRDEQNRVQNFDQYLQATWLFAPRWQFSAGVRRSVVRFSADDRFITASNPDDSGTKRYASSNPVLGLSFQPSPQLHLYGNFGRGFETPTFDELGYRPDGRSGLNFALRAARTRSGEIGAKLHWQAARVEIAVFNAETRDELAVNSNSAGRSSFQNVGRGRRAGLEFAAHLPLANGWRATAAYSYLDARFRDGFKACNNTPCTAPTRVVDAGSPMPGLPRSWLHVQASYGDEAGWHANLQAQRVGPVNVNHFADQNAPGYAIAGLSAGYGWRIGRVNWRSFLTINNLFDRSYAGSVIVNEANGRYFEPAAGRSFLLGLEIRTRD